MEVNFTEELLWQVNVTVEPTDTWSVKSSVVSAGPVGPLASHSINHALKLQREVNKLLIA